MSTTKQVASPYFQLTDQWLALVGPLGTAGIVLLKLKRYEFGRKLHNIPWPQDQRMAREMGISKAAFSKAIKKLQALGYVSVERKLNDRGGKDSYYRIDIPVDALVNLDETVEVDDELSQLDAKIDPAPVVAKKGRAAKDNEKDQLWTQFLEKCHKGLHPHPAHKIWKKMALVDCVLALSRIEEYSQIFASASGDRARFITKISNWLAKDEFKADVSVWRERAGNTLVASGHKTSYLALAMKKIQRI